MLTKIFFNLTGAHLRTILAGLRQKSVQRVSKRPLPKVLLLPLPGQKDN